MTSRIFSTLATIALFCIGVVHAQVPRTINYQGYLTGSNGPAISASLPMAFKIYGVASGGTALHTETQTVTVSNGIFNVLLGTAPPLTLPFDAPYYLGVTVGTDVELSPRQPLAASSYAIQAASATSFTGALVGDVTGTQGATAIAATTVTGKALIGFVSSAGTVSASDTVLTAINKLDGNIALAAPANSRTAQQVALLRWYGANQSGNTNFAVGTSPWGAAFDGANIWVANNGGGNVTKLRASDGACIGTCTFPVGGSYPRAIAFDGANVWVAGGGGYNNVIKLRASDGECVGVCTFAVGNSPSGIAFDGANIWVVNNGSNSVTKLRASDGACVGTCTFPVINFVTGAIAFDGANIWVASALNDSVTKLRASDGACVGTCTFSVGSYPAGIAFDGANIWVTNVNVNTVTKLRASDGACVGTCTFSVGTGPQGVAFDGANIWVTNSGSNNVTKLQASDGACVGTCTYTVGANPKGIAFDGTSIWVTNQNSNTVTKL